MPKIELIYKDDLGSRESHKEFIDKINEIITVVNRINVSLNTLYEGVIENIKKDQYTVRVHKS
jgi:undecaprenyl pyrophosphate synthase